MAKRPADGSTGVPAAPGSPYLARLTAGAQRDPIEVRELRDLDRFMTRGCGAEKVEHKTRNSLSSSVYAVAGA